MTNGDDDGGVEAAMTRPPPRHDLRRRDEEQRSVSVTRYRQHWSLLPGPDRVVRARMEVTYAVASGQISLGYKSLVDGGSLKTLRNVRVTDGTTGRDLSYELSSNGEYTFVKWRWDGGRLGTGDSAAVAVEYDIYGGVTGCDAAYDIEPDDVCSESFEAPWANYWKIPVSDVAYSFELIQPSDASFDMDINEGEAGEAQPTMVYEYPPDSLKLLEPSPCCASPPSFDLDLDDIIAANASSSSAAAERKRGPSLLQPFGPSELGIGRNPPENVAFGWKVSGPNITQWRCGDACRPPAEIRAEDGGSGVSPLIWLVLLVPGLAIAGGCLIYCRRRRENVLRQRRRVRRLREASSMDVRPVPEAKKISSAKNSSLASRTDALVKGVTATSKATAASQSCSSYSSSSAPKHGAQPAPSAPPPPPSSQLCTICMSAERCVVLLPCAHRTCCVACGEKLESCPVCRAAVEERIRTYDA